MPESSTHLPSLDWCILVFTVFGLCILFVVLYLIFYPFCCPEESEPTPQQRHRKAKRNSMGYLQA